MQATDAIRCGFKACGCPVAHTDRSALCPSCRHGAAWHVATKSYPYDVASAHSQALSRAAKTGKESGVVMVPVAIEQIAQEQNKRQEKSIIELSKQDMQGVKKIETHEIARAKAQEMAKENARDAQEQNRVQSELRAMEARERELREKGAREREAREKEAREAREKEVREREARQAREKEAREKEAREKEAREKEAREKEAREKEAREKEAREAREREAREREAREREAREKEAREAREREAREREAREREAREKEAREKEAREREAREREAREREAREREAREREAREREAREREAREREAREREAREQEIREAREREAREREAREVREKEAREREAHALLREKEEKEAHARELENREKSARESEMKAKEERERAEKNELEEAARQVRLRRQEEEERTEHAKQQKRELQENQIRESRERMLQEKEKETERLVVEREMNLANEAREREAREAKLMEREREGQEAHERNKALKEQLAREQELLEKIKQQATPSKRRTPERTKLESVQEVTPVKRVKACGTPETHVKLITPRSGKRSHSNSANSSSSSKSSSSCGSPKTLANASAASSSDSTGSDSSSSSNNSNGCRSATRASTRLQRNTVTKSVTEFSYADFTLTRKVVTTIKENLMVDDNDGNNNKDDVENAATQVAASALRQKVTPLQAALLSDEVDALSSLPVLDLMCSSTPLTSTPATNTLKTTANSEGKKSEFVARKSLRFSPALDVTVTPGQYSNIVSPATTPRRRSLRLAPLALNDTPRGTPQHANDKRTSSSTPKPSPRAPLKEMPVSGLAAIRARYLAAAAGEHNITKPVFPATEVKRGTLGSTWAANARSASEQKAADPTKRKIEVDMSGNAETPKTVKKENVQVPSPKLQNSKPSPKSSPQSRPPPELLVSPRTPALPKTTTPSSKTHTPKAKAFAPTITPHTPKAKAFTATITPHTPKAKATPTKTPHTPKAKAFAPNTTPHTLSKTPAKGSTPSKTPAKGSTPSGTPKSPKTRLGTGVTWGGVCYTTCPTKATILASGEEKLGKDAMLEWCIRVNRGFVEIKSFRNSSWHSGLGFAGLAAAYRPDLLDFDAIKSQTPLAVNTSAFKAARTMGVSVLLDPEDMPLVDDKCIITQIGQYVQHLWRKVPPALRENN